MKPKARPEIPVGLGDLQSHANRAPAVSRAATILRLLAAERSGLGVTEIARRVGLVPSTCLHVLRALVDEGFTSFDAETKTYHTGVGLLGLVRDAMAGNEYRKVAQPVLDRLAAEHGVTAEALELDGRGRMILVAITRADSLVSLHVNVGSRIPAYLGAAGRCVAAASGLSRDALRKRFSALRWEKAPRFEDWYAEVELARAEGVAVDHGNYFRGLTAVGALLPKGGDQAVRVISTVGFDHHVTGKVLRLLREDLRQCVKGIAAQLADGR